VVVGGLGLEPSSPSSVDDEVVGDDDWKDGKEGKVGGIRKGKLACRSEGERGAGWFGWTDDRV
jgi:hypothetical protein